MERYQLTDEEQHVTETIIGAAIEVHSYFGPGMLESTYEESLSLECAERNLVIRRQIGQPVFYKGLKLSTGYRIDLIVNDVVLIELKTVEKLHAVHTSQVVTYLKLSGLRVGLLLNFNSVRLRDGLKRIVLSRHDPKHGFEKQVSTLTNVGEAEFKRKPSRASRSSRYSFPFNDLDAAASHDS